MNPDDRVTRRNWRRAAWPLVALIAIGLAFVLANANSDTESSRADVEVVRTAPEALTPIADAEAAQPDDPQLHRTTVSDTPRIGGVLETFTVGAEVRVVCRMWCTPSWIDLGERLVAEDSSEQWILDRDALVRVDWGQGEAIVDIRGGLVSRCRVGGKPTRAITGSVRTVEGQPLAGMSVWAYGHRGLLPNAETTTDGDGRWSLGLGPQAAVITCSGRGHTCVREFRLPEGEGAAEVDLLARPVTDRITGICVDRSGRPVANALVYADGGARDQDTLPQALSVSQRDGTFELARPPAGWPRNCALLAWKHGWALWLRDLSSFDHDQPLTIVMGPAQQVRGRLLREDGSPFAGAEILAEGLSASTLAENRRDWTTDESGSWVMDRIDGVVALHARDSEYRPLCDRTIEGAEWDAREIVLWATPRGFAWWVPVRAGSMVEDGDRIVIRQPGGDLRHHVGSRSFWVAGEANRPTELTLMRRDRVIASETVVGDATQKRTEVFVFEGRAMATVNLVKQASAPSLRWTGRSDDRVLHGVLDGERAELQVPIGRWDFAWSVSGLPAGRASVEVQAERATTIECTGLDGWQQVSMEHEGAATLVWRRGDELGFVDYRGGPILLPVDGALSLSFQGAHSHANLQCSARPATNSLAPTRIESPCVVYTAAAQGDAVLEAGTQWFGLRGVVGSSVTVPAGTYQVLAVREGRTEARGVITVTGGAARPLVLR